MSKTGVSCIDSIICISIIYTWTNQLMLIHARSSSGSTMHAACTFSLMVSIILQRYQYIIMHVLFEWVHIDPIPAWTSTSPVHPGHQWSLPLPFETTENTYITYIIHSRFSHMFWHGFVEIFLQCSVMHVNESLINKYVYPCFVGNKVGCT